MMDRKSDAHCRELGRAIASAMAGIRVIQAPASFVHDVKTQSGLGRETVIPMDHFVEAYVSDELLAEPNWADAIARLSFCDAITEALMDEYGAVDYDDMTTIALKVSHTRTHPRDAKTDAKRNTFAMYFGVHQRTGTQ